MEHAAKLEWVARAAGQPGCVCVCVCEGCLQKNTGDAGTDTWRLRDSGERAAASGSKQKAIEEGRGLPGRGRCQGTMRTRGQEGLWREQPATHRFSRRIASLWETWYTCRQTAAGEDGAAAPRAGGAASSAREGADGASSRPAKWHRAPPLASAAAAARGCWRCGGGPSPSRCAKSSPVDMESTESSGLRTRPEAGI